MTRQELVHNEKSKLAATGCNTLAASCVTVGVLTPLVTMLIYLNTDVSEERAFIVVFILFVSLMLGLYLHLLARRYLEELHV